MLKASANNLNEDDVVIARIAKARGIGGEVACDIETDFPERFQALEGHPVTLVMPNGLRLALNLEHHWFHQNRVILKFSGIDTMTEAERLAGGRLVIPQTAALDLEADEFYEYDLIGLEVVTVDGQSVGRVVRLLRTGGTDLLIIDGQPRGEILIPFVEEICQEVDLINRRIMVDPPAGLLEL